MMQFEHQGDSYKLEFERRTTSGRRITWARLIRIEEPGGLTAVDETVLAVGHSTCHPGDRFSREEGRQVALRHLSSSTPDLDRALRGKMMHTYFNRPRPSDPAALRAAIEVLSESLSRCEAKG
jgi:hypothetical protein